ncbi:MAG: NADH-quinone oxidoreductase subunit J [Verrucomicrobiota bacterium]|nr:NADH-quinone oxidoreductase subunit J [Verrucomicrobiota bacterium]
MSPLLFWVFAVMTLVFAIAVVANRNPVASALSLVVSFLGLAALFVGLDAYFIAIIQVLVYAGAVMVLFLFIIMLLDLRAEERRKLNYVAYAGGGLVTLAFIAQLWLVLQKFHPGQTGFPALPRSNVDDVYNIGRTLFQTHNLPFQVIGVLVLVATIGVVVLSKRELK